MQVHYTFLFFFFNLYIINFIKEFSITETLNQLNAEIVNKPKETLKLLIPALLYTLQNNLYFIALSNLDVVTYQVTYQLKIFATALFSYLILGKKLNIYKYLSLFILVVGVSLVQYSKTNEKKEFKSNMIGFISVFISCLTSGFTGVYFEKLLKSSNSGVCIRNIQLGVFGIIFSFLAIFTYDFKLVVNNGFFNGYNSIVWIVIFVQV